MKLLFRRLQERILEMCITANVFPIWALSIKETSCNNSACPFSQTSRRTTGGLEFTCLSCLYRHCETLIPSPFTHIQGEINESFALISVQPQFWLLFLLCLSRGLERFLKKSVKLHRGDPTHYSHFSWGKGKKCFYSLGKPCRSSRGTICVETISSTHQQASFLTGF